MTARPSPETGAIRRRIREALSEYPVSFAAIFGSVGTGDTDAASDIDVVVDFDASVRDRRDRTATYLQVVTALTDEFDRDVDVVDIASTSPEFARSILDTSLIVIGTETTRQELAARYAGELPSREEATTAISEAVDRMKTTDNDGG